MGVWIGDRSGVFSRVDYFFACDFGIGAFMKLVILVGLGVHYFSTGGGAIECC